MTDVTVEKKGGVARVAMNRPERRNGMNMAMLAGMIDALEEIASDDSIRVVVVTGNGKDFSVGADLALIAGDESGNDEGEWTSRLWDTYRIPLVLHDMPQVTLAAIDGACAGAAFGIACAADLRFASDRALFTTAFLKVGAAGDMSGAWTLPRILGRAKAHELYFLPEKIRAAEALEIGLVNRVFAAEDFAAEIDAITERLAASAPLALRGIKANFKDAETLGLADYVPVESKRHSELMATADAREAARAFMQKRTPVFEGH